MKPDLKCFVGNHKYVIYAEEDLKLAGTDIIVGKAIISRCENCGKIKIEEVRLISYNY